MGSIVSTSNGPVRGQLVDGVARFLGIPYAAAPFGPRRFTAPVSARPWAQPFEALDFGPTVPKSPYPAPLNRLLGDSTIEGDDCLNLNVWTPDPAAAGLPVLVWLHGGSLLYGSSSLPVYDGQAFARDGVVYVSINYRLGVEGFGAFPDAPANRGLLDAVAALRWVRDNIAAFGGDPGNVTVFGESAGATLISGLLASPLATGLIRRAVMQSGPPETQPMGRAQRTVRLMAKRLGVPATAAAFASVDRRALLAAQQAVTTGKRPLSGANGFGLVVDPDTLPEEPAAALARGVAAHVDLLVGYNTEEYRLWFVPTGAIDRLNGFMVRLALWKSHVANRVAAVYRRNRPGARPAEILGAIVTDRLLRVPLNRIADERPGHTYMYEFGWRSPVDGLGACHGLEIGFVFDNLDKPDSIVLAGTQAPQELADAMHRAWIDFAATGEPGWRSWDAARPVMLFDLPAPVLTPAPRDDELALWPPGGGTPSA